MIHYLKTHNKVVVVALLALSLAGAWAQGTGRRRSNRYIYVRSASKVYAFLPAYMMDKSMGQMQTEAVEGRQRFQKIFDAGPDPVKDLLKFVTPVKDQGHRGTCVAFASVALIETEVKSLTGQNSSFSEQYAYWASKAVEQINPNADGSEPIGMLQTLDREGTTTERVWPYEPNPWFADKAGHPDCYKAYQANPDDVPTECVTNGNPPAAAKSAGKITVSEEQNVPTSPESIVGFIESGVPVEVGLDVYSHAWGFDNPDSPNFKAGVVEMPRAGDKVIGGHAILIVGYDKNAQVYLFKNSWGTDDWGSQSKVPGFGVIPMNYVRKFGQASVAKVNQ